LSDEADRRGTSLSGLIHCFTGGPAFASQCLALGLDISFSGIVTFANAPAVAEAADIVPLDCIHIETDSPYLMPRNCPVKTRRCEPSFVRYTGEFIAARRGIDPNAFIRQCATNTRRLFFSNVPEASE
jgi:TatD DNase family protein